MRDLQIHGKKRRRLLSEKLFQEDLWLNTPDIFSVVNLRPFKLSAIECEIQSQLELPAEPK